MNAATPASRILDRFAAELSDDAARLAHLPWMAALGDWLAPLFATPVAGELSELWDRRLALVLIQLGEVLDAEDAGRPFELARDLAHAVRREVDDRDDPDVARRAEYRIHALCGALVDASRSELEWEDRADRARVSATASALAHDVRRRIDMGITAIRALRRGAPAQDSDALEELILESTRRSLDIVERVGAVTNAARPEIPIPLDQVLTEVVRKTSRDRAEAGVQIEVKELPTVPVESGRVEVLLTELVRSALKRVEDREVGARLEISGEIRDGTIVDVRMRGRGFGEDPEEEGEDDGAWIVRHALRWLEASLETVEEEDARSIVLSMPMKRSTGEPVR